MSGYISYRARMAKLAFDIGSHEHPVTYAADLLTAAASVLARLRGPKQTSMTLQRLADKYAAEYAAKVRGDTA